MKNMLITLLAIVGLSSLHQTQATVLYSENFEGTDVVAGNPADFGNYNLDNTGWGWGVTAYNSSGVYQGNYFPSGGPNKGLYSVRTGQTGANQGLNMIAFGGDYGNLNNIRGGNFQTTTFYNNLGNVTQSMVDQGYVSLSLNYKVMAQSVGLDKRDYCFVAPSTGRFFIEVLGMHEWGYMTDQAPYGASTSFTLLDSQVDWNENVFLNLALNSGLLGKTLQFGIDLTTRNVGTPANPEFSNTAIGVDNIVFQTASAPITAAIPEPSVASLLGFGVLGLVATRLRRRS